MSYLDTRVRVTADRGVVTDADGWTHHAYRVQLIRPGDDGSTVRSPAFDWREGMAHHRDSLNSGRPATDADGILEALLSDAAAWLYAATLDDFASEFGLDTETRTDYRRAEKLYAACRETHRWLTEFLPAPGRTILGDPLENLGEYLAREGHR